MILLTPEMRERLLAVRVSLSTVGRTKRRFVEGNLERALSEEPHPGAERKLTGKEEALLVATACARPPAGRKRWTLTLLADAMVKLTDQTACRVRLCAAGWPTTISSRGAGQCRWRIRRPHGGRARSLC